MNGNLNRQEMMEQLFVFVEGVDYGEVVITIHDSQVVQVEKRIKKRFSLNKRLQ